MSLLNLHDTTFEERHLAFLDQCLNNCIQTIPQPFDLTESNTAKFFQQYRAGLSTRCMLKNHVHKFQAKPKKEALPSRSPLLPAAWLTEIDTFAREALHITLFPHQKQLCLSSARITILVAGRGAGKSVAAQVKALHQAVSQPQHTVLVVSSGQRMSSDFGTKLLDLIRESPLREWTESISQEQVLFKNLSVIKFLPANPDTIRGYHPRIYSQDSGMTVILDEACFMEQGDEVRKAVEYALITTSPEKGKLYIVSSPSTVGSWVYQYVQKSQHKESGIAVIHCASHANPTIPKEELERLKQTKNELEYRAEVLAEWTDSAYGLFSGILESNIQPIDPASFGEAMVAMGVDLALSFSPAHDRNAIAILARMDTEWDEPLFTLLDLKILEQASDHEIRATIKDLQKTYPIATAAIEQYQGKALAEFCQTQGIETTLVAPTSGLQQTIFHELHRLLKQGRLRLASHLPELFFQEMKAFEYRREPNGLISFGHPASAKCHDDTVYATVWALYAATLFHPPKRQPAIPPLIRFIDP